MLQYTFILIKCWDKNVIIKNDNLCDSGEGGEGGEEGGPPDSPGSKLAGDDASSEPVSPSSAAAADSPGGLHEDAAVTPEATAPMSPVTPSPMIVDGHDAEPEVAISMLHDPLSLR